jgi:hypothetical protein
LAKISGRVNVNAGVDMVSVDMVVKLSSRENILDCLRMAKLIFVFLSQEHCTANL